MTDKKRKAKYIPHWRPSDGWTIYEHGPNNAWIRPVLSEELEELPPKEKASILKRMEIEGEARKLMERREELQRQKESIDDSSDEEEPIEQESEETTTIEVNVTRPVEAKTIDVDVTLTKEEVERLRKVQEQLKALEERATIVYADMKLEEFNRRAAKLERAAKVEKDLAGEDSK